MLGKRDLIRGIFLLLLIIMASLIFAQNQEIVVWGRDNYGQISDIPAGEDFIAIAAKGDHSLALRQNGSLAAWGLNTNGQCNVPAGNDFVSIATGNFHSLAIREDGTIASWGRDTEGQVSNTPTTSDFVAVSGGYYHSLALRDNGTLVGWGANSYNQTTVPTGNDFIAVGAGGFHSIALRLNGTIVAWGRNWNNVLNVPAGNDFIAISAGYYQNIALRSNGTVVVWGGNEYNQVTHTPTTNDFMAVSTGLGHSMALREDGSITCWGAGEEGQSGLFDYGQSIDPVGNDFVGIAAGRVHSVALRTTEPPSEYTLTIEVFGNGTTTPVPGDHVYDVGEEVEITAIPGDEWLFVRWMINDVEVLENPHTVTMNTNITANAYFEPEVPFLPPPENLTGTAGDGVVYLEWDFPNLPVFYTRQDLQGFNVYRDNNLLNTELFLETFYDDFDVENGTTYTYYVTAVYVEGESEPSNEVVVTPNPIYLPPPTNLTYEIIDTTLLLSWDEPDIDELPLILYGYNVYRNSELIMELLDDTTYLYEDLIPGIYTFYVTAVYDLGESGPSNVVEISTSPPPPTNLTYEVLDYVSVSLMWDEPVFYGYNLIGYNVYRDEEVINPAPVQETFFLDCCLIPDNTYTYYVTALYDEGESGSSNEVVVYVTSADENFLPITTKLLSNYPNPFNPLTTISFALAEPGITKIEIYNNRGQRIITLIDDYMEIGQHRVTWNGRDNRSQEVGSGIYFYRMNSGDYLETRKMILMK